MSEAVDGEWHILLDNRDAALVLRDRLNTAIGSDPNRPDAWAALTSIGEGLAVPDGLSDADLWAWVKAQTCCLSDD